MDYKELQEEFVRDHNGTSMSEVFMTLSILPVSVYLPQESFVDSCIQLFARVVISMALWRSLYCVLYQEFSLFFGMAPLR